MNKKSILLGILLLLLSSFTLYSEDTAENISVDYHVKGDQVFSIDLGLFLPLFYMDFTTDNSDYNFTSDTQLSIGGSGFISYGSYLNNNILVGAEFGGIFCYSPNENLFSMVPITVKGTYEWYLNHQFSIPLSMAAGISFTSYLENFHMDPLIMPGIGFNWYYNSNLAIGIKANYWIVPQFYQNSDYNLVGNFTDVRLSVQYNLSNGR